MTEEQIAAMSDAELEMAFREADSAAAWARQGRRSYDTRRGFGADRDREEEVRISKDLLETDDILGALRAEREHRAWLSEPPYRRE